MHFFVGNMQFLVGYFIYIKYSSHRTVKSIKLCLPNFESFSLQDLERLKDDNKWLSDSHVTLILLFVLFFFCVNKTVIGFEIAPTRTFGGTSGSNFLTLSFGHSF